MIMTTNNYENIYYKNHHHNNLSDILYIYNNSNNLMLIQPLDLHLHRSPVFRPGATPHSRPAETKGFS